MRFLRIITRLCLFGFLGAGWLSAAMYLYLSPTLPAADTLRDVKLQTPMRVYSSDEQLIGQFGEQKRSPLRYEEIPQQFIDALLAAEDDAFFKHNGIDIKGLMRATSELILTGKKGSGGSTLTMQVARNYFLTLEQTFIRKFREILLAIEIERQLSKQEIFELYVNRIFLGHRAYGFESAAQVYYGKPLAELSLAEHAMLAGVPKAPSTRNPVSNPKSSTSRRNWILGRMKNLGMITADHYEQATASIDTAQLHDAHLNFHAPYPAELARQEMLDRFGSEAYSEGFNVYLTVDSTLQASAQRAIKTGLLAYDQRHGYRGPEQHLSGVDGSLAPDSEKWNELVQTLSNTPVIADLMPAIVINITEAQDDTAAFADILLPNGIQDRLDWDAGPSKAQPYLNESRRGDLPATMADALQIGDMIRVERNNDNTLQLRQIPAAQSSLVSLNPDNGAILALVGGLGFELSKFNRATQAKRQPGSNFKPFLYSAALENGFTAASLINDAPVVLNNSAQEQLWRPENDSGRFFGPTRLRWALTKSRNLVSIRLLQQLGIRKTIEYATALGFDTSDFPRDLSLALGSLVITPLELASHYATLANGGYRIHPYLIERIEDSYGNIVFQAEPPQVCRDCDTLAAKETEEPSMNELLGSVSKAPQTTAPRVMGERVNFIIDSILQDVIKRGTGRRALALGRNDLAGKTGTTNGPMDAWFSGYNRDIVTTTWVGFDNYTPLGRREFGGTAALPIWIDYMRDALVNSEDKPRRRPANIVTTRLDPTTGKLATPQQSNALFEYFRAEYAPQTQQRSDNSHDDDAAEDLINDIF